MRRNLRIGLIGVGLVGLFAGHRSVAWAQQVRFLVDTAQDRLPISPLIYGVNAQLDQAPYGTIHAALARQGGNRWTAYNFLNNASNAGSDWKFENDNFLGGGSSPAGAVLPFLRGAQAAGAVPLLTVPIAGYVAADESGPVNGGNAPTTPPSQSSHVVPEFPTPADDPANGTPDAKDHVYQSRFVAMMKSQMAAAPDLPLAFCLDNEPDLWNTCHPEVHPSPVTYAELVDRSVAYAKMIKSIDPRAIILGPVSYGWNGYVTLQNAPDSAANGNFLNYYLNKMNQRSRQAGTRLLDALDLHWYPEATGPNAAGQPTRINGNDASPGVVAARLQAPRSLWDPGYLETCWFTRPDTGPNGTAGKPICLIPAMQAKIAANYRGTHLAFSEYDYGGGDSISGALAEADVLGIFGKYRVFAAAQWADISPEPFTLAGFKMFRNYDGHGGSFGDTSVLASDSDTADTSFYASIDSHDPGHLTLVLINKELTPVISSLKLTGATYRSGAVYQLTSAAAEPVSVGDLAVKDDTVNYTMPGYSVSTISLHATP